MSTIDASAEGSGLSEIAAAAQSYAQSFFGRERFLGAVVPLGQIQFTAGGDPADLAKTMSNSSWTELRAPLLVPTAQAHRQEGAAGLVKRRGDAPALCPMTQSVYEPADSSVSVPARISNE